MTSSIQDIDLAKGTKVKRQYKKKTLGIIEEFPLIACKYCQKTFSRQCNYDKHYEYVHSKTVEYLEKAKQASLLDISIKQEFPDPEQKCVQIKSEPTKSLICKKCNKEFPNETALKQHRVDCKIEPGEKDPLYCNICSRNFFYESALEKHRELHLTKEASFSCSHCPQKFFQKTNLVQHEYTHTRPLHACYICNKTFNKVYHLKSHLRLHGKGNRNKLTCDQCGKSFQSKVTLEVHIKNHTKVMQFKCDGCETEFSNKTTFIRHMQIKINNNTKYRCELCGKVCCHKKHLDYHVSNHTVGSLVFSCGQCKVSFKNEFEFRSHMHTHITIKTRFSCDSCGIVFSSHDNLAKHTRGDTMVLECTACKREFKCVRGFKLHYCRENDGKLKQFQHEIVDSSAEDMIEASTYKNPPNKIKHRDHTYALQSWPIKPYKCKKCGKHFCRLVNLEKHIQEIHPFYLSAESSEENSEDEREKRSRVYYMPKIESITSLKIENEQVFVSDENLQDQNVEHDEQLVDPLLIDGEQTENNLETSVASIVKIEPSYSLEGEQIRTRINEMPQVVHIKQEIMDYESG